MSINGKIVQKSATAAWCKGGKYAGLLSLGSGFDAALGFDFILNVLCFFYVIRDGVEWWQSRHQSSRLREAKRLPGEGGKGRQSLNIRTKTVVIKKVGLLIGGAKHVDW